MERVGRRMEQRERKERRGIREVNDVIILWERKK